MCTSIWCIQRLTGPDLAPTDFPFVYSGQIQQLVYQIVNGPCSLYRPTYPHELGRTEGGLRADQPHLPPRDQVKNLITLWLLKIIMPGSVAASSNAQKIAKTLQNAIKQYGIQLYGWKFIYLISYFLLLGRISGGHSNSTVPFPSLM